MSASATVMTIPFRKHQFLAKITSHIGIPYPYAGTVYIAPKQAIRVSPTGTGIPRIELCIREGHYTAEIYRQTVSENVAILVVERGAFPSTMPRMPLRHFPMQCPHSLHFSQSRMISILPNSSDSTHFI